MSHLANSENEIGAAETPVVSVVVPAYKVAPFIKETLESVMAQSLKQFEVIVVNDGSPDTQELEANLEEFLPHIVYIKQENQGAGAARNAALRKARGELVAFLDGDDAWLPHHLDEQVSLIRSGYDFIYSDAVNFGDLSPGGTCRDTNPSAGKVTFESLVAGRCSVITSTVVVRRDAVVRVGLFDERFRNSQDFELWLRLAKLPGFRMGFQDTVTARRRVYSGSLASDPLRSLEAELAVLASMGQRTDLTPEERKTLDETAALRHSTAEVVKGKSYLAQGDFSTAAAAFASANKYSSSLKLRLVLFWLRIAPRALQQAYRLRRT